MTQSARLRERAAEAASSAPAVGRRRPLPAGQRELAVFLAGAAVIAMHVADDSFLQPQPGTSAGDHLVSGLVPLAVLALAAAGYVRLRGGGRAAIALVVGFFGIVFGVEAVYYSTRVGPSGDDFTGLLSMVAGLMLLGLGLVTL